MKEPDKVLIFEVLASGLPGELLEQHQVDVENAVGLAARKLTDELWEVLFVSASRRKVYGYNFRFVYGFSPHRFCAVATGVQEAPPWRSGAAFAWPRHTIAALALAMTRVSLG
ncbi:hypothetical protein AK812_SmicGene863 [Symbiodinium microadriaticum]|uniref:Uncharacterized protein n=1 Tax=Symbiodinium microadriaticum TaxID=2951 RepID=A0A1Q9F5L9_SYMMI|nr:hypothetical protein AK812_SmicGene863 [Symbiodinium microadriaticum]